MEAIANLICSLAPVLGQTPLELWREVGSEMGVRRKVRFSDQGPSIHPNMITITQDTEFLEVPRSFVCKCEIKRRPSGFDKSEIQRMRAARVAEEEMDLYAKDIASDLYKWGRM